MQRIEWVKKEIIITKLNMDCIMYLSIAIIVITFITVMVILSKTDQVQKLLNKKSNYHFQIDRNFDNEKLSKMIYELTTSYKYNLKIKNNNQYIISDGISFFSWGYLYLIENVEGAINIYFLPKYNIEYNCFGELGRKLQKLKAHIEVINSVIS